MKEDGQGKPPAPYTEQLQHTSSGKKWLVTNVLLGFGFFLVFAAFSAVQNLANVIITQNGLGSTSLAVIYCVLTFSSVIAPAVVRKIGGKMSIVLGQASYCLYVAANLFPRFYTLIPTAVVMGFGASILWTAQGVYITYIARAYAMDRGANVAGAIGLFTGIFWGMFQSTQIVGNLISWQVLAPYGNDIPNHVTYLLYGVFTALAVGGTLVSLLLRSIPKDGRYSGPSDYGDTAADDSPLDSRSAWETITSNLRITADWRVALLLCAFFYSGLEQAWCWGTFTSQVIVTKSEVGKYMLVFGVTDVLGSLAFGRLGSTLPRVAIIVMIGFASHALVFGYAMFLGYPEVHNKWETGGNLTINALYASESFVSTAVGAAADVHCIDGCWGFYAGAALLGIGDSVWNTQLSNLLSTHFRKEETSDAFASWKLWQALATAIVFFYAPHLLTSVGFLINTGIVTAFLVLGTGGTLILLMLLSRRRNNQTYTVIN